MSVFFSDKKIQRRKEQNTWQLLRPHKFLIYVSKDGFYYVILAQNTTRCTRNQNIVILSLY